MSRFVISCGGTGGHLSPGIALAEGLVARGHEVKLLISQKKVDARLIEKYPHLPFLTMPGSGFAWQPRALARFAWTQLRAVHFCRRLLREWRADAVVGFGGFTSGPIVIAGRLLGVPVALHESNRVPGRAVRVLGRLAQRVYLPVGIRIEAIDTDTTRHMGLPVRREIVRQPQAEARAALGLEPQQPVLVVLGGSQGASALNDWTRKHFESLAAEGVQVYCVTGLGKGREEIIEFKTKQGAPVRAVFAAFTDRMAVVMSAADLVLSRAGAGTLGELIRCETPAILVPFPQAADDHQRANAAFFAHEGGGLVVEQSAMDGLREQVTSVIFNEWWLKKFRTNLRRMDRANALEFMLRDLEEIAGPRAPTESTAFA